jgi:predicted DNA-binding transcriptional regulator AlpA
MPASPLERLPVELLQSIFASADHNLALPQASALLGARLSDTYIYNTICAKHFPSGPKRLSRIERAAAQTFLFTRRWMTWSFFQAWILRTWGSKGCLCGRESCFDAQWPPHFADATTMVFSRSHLPRLAFMWARLPVKLLHGPWTREKIEFLRFLLWVTGMTVDWADDGVREVVQQGRREAMLERNLEAVELFNHVRRMGRAPSLDTIRFAVLEAGCDRSIVYDTLRTAHAGFMRSDAWKCAVLDEWCAERIAAQDSRGMWLRDRLEVLRAGGDVSSLKEETGGELVVHSLNWNKVS